MPVFDFNTSQTVDALGSAISGISEEILRNIEVTIKKYEREKLSERSQENERTDLHSQRGLLDSQSEPVPAGEQAPGQVREDAEEVSSKDHTPVSGEFIHVAALAEHIAGFLSIGGGKPGDIAHFCV